MNASLMSTKAVTTALHQVSSLLKHPSFIKQVCAHESRFSVEVGKAIQTKIASNLIHDVATYVHHNSDASTSETLRLTPSSEKHLLKQLFNQASDSVLKHAHSLKQDVPLPSQRFSVPKDGTFIASSLKVIGHHACLDLMNTLGQWTDPGSEHFRIGARFSYLNHLLNALYCWVEAKDTTLNDVNNDIIEHYLSHADRQGANYWLKGYPYDVLVHDKVVAIYYNPTGGFKGLGYNKSYVATHAWAENRGLSKELVTKYADAIISQQDVQTANAKLAV